MTKHLHKAELMEKVVSMTEMLGDKAMIQAMALALDSDTLQDILEYIDGCHDLGAFDRED